MTSPKNNWSVYIHTCKINQKSYVGITSKKPEHRWNYGNGYTGKSIGDLEMQLDFLWK